MLQWDLVWFAGNKSELLDKPELIIFGVNGGKSLTNNEYPRLCGGTFFTLVLEDIKQRFGVREHYRGESDGLTDPDVLIGLIMVIQPDYQRPKKKMSTKVNDFKSCNLSTGEYLPFGKTAEIEEFDNRVRNEYQTVLAAMSEFVDSYLEIGASGKRDYKLVKALMDLISQDDSIGKKAPAEDEFFVDPNGIPYTCEQLVQMDKVNLPAFLLGVWHFCCIHRKNNKVGRLTYDTWCPANGGGPRGYEGDMGKNWPTDITFYNAPTQGKNTTEAETEIVEEPVQDDNAYRDPGGPKLGQFLANPKANVHYGSGDIYSDIETLNITKNYYGGKGE